MHFIKIRAFFQALEENFPRESQKSIVLGVSYPVSSLLGVSFWLFSSPLTFYWGKKLTSGTFQ
jgi:hypothetical protein